MCSLATRSRFWHLLLGGRRRKPNLALTLKWPLSDLCCRLWGGIVLIVRIIIVAVSIMGEVFARKGSVLVHSPVRTCTGFFTRRYVTRFALWDGSSRGIHHESVYQPHTKGQRSGFMHVKDQRSKSQKKWLRGSF